MPDLAPLAPAAFTVGLLLLLFLVLGHASKVARALAAILCIALTFRYMVWRVLHTTPTHQNLAQHLYARLFLTIELATLISSCLVYFFMSRTVDRKHDATLHANSPLHSSPTDVFVASYNESRDILERTLVGALALNHPDLRVWLLDDGARPWARELAESLGCMYISRHKGKHAKAGNINNAMQAATRPSDDPAGRAPHFLLLLDADFVPHRTLLARVLGLFDDPTVGIVQTPQHFFNPDPVQSNLLCTAVWPDEQRFFFNCLLPSKDAWGAAFCCGTSAVFRVQAFLTAGGMATETVTEDMLTTFKFEEFGYRTIFLNERLSLGLAPESLVDFIGQRARWCLGAIQQIFTRWSFFGPSRMSLINRLAFFDTVLYWCSGAAFKIMLLSAPMLYWFTGTACLHATGTDLLLYAAPMVFANLLFMHFLAGNRVLPIMTDVTQLLTAFVIVRTVVTGLIRPFGRPFKVTAKGLSTTGITIQWGILWKFAILSALTLLGVILHIAQFSPAHGSQGYAANIFWSVVNATVLALAAAACIELPHRRRDERFQTVEPARVRLASYSAEEPAAPSLDSATWVPPGETDLPCILNDISLGGAALTRLPNDAQHWRDLSGPAHLILHDECGNELALPFTVVDRRDATLTLQFHPDPWIRHALIRRLFTGAYHHDVEQIATHKVFATLAQALFH